MSTTSNRLLVALGTSLSGAGITLQAIGIATVHYQLAIQIVAVAVGFVGMFVQGVTKPVQDVMRKDPSQGAAQ